MVEGARALLVEKVECGNTKIPRSLPLLQMDSFTTCITIISQHLQWYGKQHDEHLTIALCYLLQLSFLSVLKHFGFNFWLFHASLLSICCTEWCIKNVICHLCNGEKVSVTV